MRSFFVFILLFMSGILVAQDLDIYKHQKNSNFQWPKIPKEMSFEEFEILSTELRMQDMMIAAVFPGHIHFKIKENKTGYYILGTRGLGYMGIIYLAAVDQPVTDIIISDTTGIDPDISTSDYVVAYTSIALIVGSYLYDWIHGKYLLDKKQNTIRYKYARKLSLNFSNIKQFQKMYPGLTLTYNF